MVIGVVVYETSAQRVGRVDGSPRRTMSDASILVQPTITHYYGNVEQKKKIITERIQIQRVSDDDGRRKTRTYYVRTF